MEDEGIVRLRRFFAYVFAKHDQDQLPPPPQELIDWSQDTLLAAFAGTVIGGSKQWFEERRAGPPVAPHDAPTPAHAARAIAEENTQRLVRVFDASLRGGFKIAGVAAIYYATQLLSSIYRAQQDFLNSAYGGIAAGAVFGAFGVRQQRLRSMVLGAALGGTIGIPAGLLQEKIAQYLPPEHRDLREHKAVSVHDIIKGEEPVIIPEYQGKHSTTTTTAIIKQLEGSLAKSPTQQKPPLPANNEEEATKGRWRSWFGKRE